MGERNSPMLYPGRDGPAGLRRMQSPQQQQQKPFDPTEDDPVDHPVVPRGGANGQGDHPSAYIVAPSILVRPEFSTITRTHERSQPLTCIVVIELPSRRTSTHVPGPVMNDYRSPSAQGSHNGMHARHETAISSNSSNRYGSSNYSSTYSDSASTTRRLQPPGYNARSPSPDRQRASVTDTETDAYTEPPATFNSENDSPFKNITEEPMASLRRP